jgi:hypothetical protein
MNHFKDGNTDIGDQPRCGPPRTAATERNKQKVDELIRQDRRITVKRNCSAAWSWALCGPRDDGDFGISEICSRWVPRLLMGTEENITAGRGSPIHTRVPI